MIFRNNLQKIYFKRLSVTLNKYVKALQIGEQLLSKQNK